MRAKINERRCNVNVIQEHHGGGVGHRRASQSFAWGGGDMIDTIPNSNLVGYPRANKGPKPSGDRQSDSEGKSSLFLFFHLSLSTPTGYDKQRIQSWRTRRKEGKRLNYHSCAHPSVGTGEEQVDGCHAVLSVRFGHSQSPDSPSFMPFSWSADTKCSAPMFLSTAWFP